MKSFVMCLLGLVFLAGVYYGFDPPPKPVTEPPIAVATSVDRPASAEPRIFIPSTLNLTDFSTQCVRDIRARNPRGRLLRLSANRLGDRCSGIVETRPGSGRWLFDWRDGEHWERKGELVLPASWPREIPGDGIADEALTHDVISAHMVTAHAWIGELKHDEWTYEVLWLPPPFVRPITAITLSDVGPEAVPYGSWTMFLDAGIGVDEATDAQANALYPMTRFELREDHNFKGTLYESTALAETAVSLETDPNAGADSALLTNAELCMSWLHKANTGGRVIRVGIDVEHCFLTLENAKLRDVFYLLTTSADDAFVESASLQLDASVLPNLLLDRSRLTMPRLRERLAQAQAQPGGVSIDHIAIFWLSNERMLWQFSSGPDVRAHLDESGQLMDAPAQFPVTRAELDRGFPASSPVMDVVAER